MWVGEVFQNVFKTTNIYFGKFIFKYYDQWPLHFINSHHLGGPGGQGEGVQGGPLQVGDGPHESGKMLELSK